MHRGVDAEGGGVAELQTDVMRFMAILAICLVVIFALVQSIPLSPTPPTAEAVSKVEPEPVARPQPVAEPVAAAPPTPAAEPPPAVEQLAPQPVVERPAAEPAPASPAAPPADGFTLRFESDLALKRLVARNVVGLYAIDNAASLRLNVSDGRMSFWEASTPNQYHEMDRATVPADVVRALLRTAAIDATAIKWGVTLPAGMQRELNGLLASSSGGALVIGSDGRLRLEQ